MICLRITGWIAAVLAGTMLLAAVAGTAARAAYRLGPGDVIEIAVFGMPELTREARIEVDGTIAFPIIGSLSVAGLTLGELRKRVRSALGGRVVTSNGAGGESAVAIGMDDIVVGVASYRPIYVKGDVTRPGEYAYRGPMSIREAIALAGGYLGLRGDTHVNVAFNALDASAEREAHWQTIARQRATIWRIEAELGKAQPERAAAERAIPPDLPLEPSVRESIVSQAVTQLESRNARFERERNALENFIGQLDDEIAIAEEQVEVEDKSYAADSAELKSLSDLKSDGIVTSKRISDARRAMLFSSTRLLQARVRLSEARRQRAERELQLHKLETDRKGALYDALEVAETNEAAARIAVRAASRKLRLARAIPPRLPSYLSGDSGDGAGLDLVVYRRTADGIERYVEDEDFEILPGDVIEVRMDDPGALDGGVAHTGQLPSNEGIMAGMRSGPGPREDVE
ncbi:MAG: polysaccharide biosynthesis/export family protein [Dichotomicrobium sp.]